MSNRRTASHLGRGGASQLTKLPGNKHNKPLRAQQKRIKELECLHRVAILVGETQDVSTLIASAVELLPDAMQFPEIAGARITIADNTVATPLFSKTPWVLSATHPGIKESCVVEVCYAESPPGAGKDPFLAEERVLVSWVAATLAESIRRVQSSENVLQQERVFRATFDQAAVGLAHVSETGHLLRVNTRLADMLGYPEDELLKLDFRTITHPEDVANDKAFTAKMLAGEIDHYSLERRYIRKDGSYMWGNLTTGMVKSGEVFLFFVAIIEDVSERKTAEQELREKTEMLGQFFDVTLDLLCIASADGYFLQLNRAWENILGYTCEELVGNRLLDFVHPDDVDTVKDALATLRRQQPVPGFANRCRRKDGSYCWLDWRCAPVGELIYATARDMTEVLEAQEHLRQTSAYLENLVECANASIIVWDPERRITQFNQASERLSGLTAAEAIGQDLAVLFPEDSRTESLDLIMQAMGGKNLDSIEIPIRQRSDAPRIALWSSANIYASDGEAPIATIAQGQDITERKHAENALHDLATTLEERVVKRTEELAGVNKELEAFAYAVSHDLRAPLRAIDGFSRALMEDYGEELDALAHNYLERLQAGSQRMAKLIDALLQLSRLTRADIRCEDVDVSAMANEIFDQLIQVQSTRNVVINVAEDIHVVGDTNLLRVALQNLLTNAWKFTNNVSPAKITVNSTVGPSGETTISVSDNGAGFNMAYVDKLFQPFQRLHNTSEYEGTGIGLATVQRVIRRHGGSVSAHGEPKNGATFSITLPKHMVDVAPTREG